ncbi:hypothetical protein CRG98_029598 [Punica granatum]|uniref:Reverse transcriptase Ty1/copia-type domain-containing protein n=1 Tax=Punica granatum TaxID=22663 RepID=A0A2I0J187_PUNGR|nr:hypothetical protein CRG98_029598 [Punica granatum]
MKSEMDSMSKNQVWDLVDPPEGIIPIGNKWVFKRMVLMERYQSNPRPDHWTAVKNILKYLRRTKDMILVYGGGELRLDGFTNSDFQLDVDDRKSISDYIFTCNGGAFS